MNTSIDIFHKISSHDTNQLERSETKMLVACKQLSFTVLSSADIYNYSSTCSSVSNSSNPFLAFAFLVLYFSFSWKSPKVEDCGGEKDCGGEAPDGFIRFWMIWKSSSPCGIRPVCNLDHTLVPIKETVFYLNRLLEFFVYKVYGTLQIFKHAHTLLKVRIVWF